MLNSRKGILVDDVPKMKRRSGIIAIISTTCLLGLLSFSTLGEAGEGTLDKLGPASDLSLESLRASSAFRDLPSISGEYSVKGRRIMPYIGAGFGHAYSSDVDRSMHSSPSGQTDPGLRSLFGQGLTPSEFQMGLRIPF